jgi:CD2 antigen cytoplasmic tail-binding protein 2
MAERKSKSVRFDGGVGASITQQHGCIDFAAEGARLKKRPRLDERPNEDEIDDVDDWVGDDEEIEAGLPSEKEQLEARRSRRQKRQRGLPEDADMEQAGTSTSTEIDQATSLTTEGIAVEPFHMENEKSDGTGYFDGDTYIFRKRDADEEPDAWLESLEEANDGAPAGLAGSEGSTDKTEEVAPKKQKELTSEELYAKIVPLVSDTETVLQAIARYGNLLRRGHSKKKKSLRPKNVSSSQNDSSAPIDSFHLAQSALNELTETASALLSLGDVDVYQKTRNDVLLLLPNRNVSVQVDAAKPGARVFWEYKGKQDGKIHGPFSTQQMKSWIQAGYFVGSQSVQVRSIKERNKSTGDDLLSDLMDDSDKAESQGTEGSRHDRGTLEQIRGEWILSEKVVFEDYA